MDEDSVVVQRPDRGRSISPAGLKRVGHEEELTRDKGLEKARAVLLRARTEAPFWHHKLGSAGACAASWSSLPATTRSEVAADLEATFATPHLSVGRLRQHLDSNPDAYLDDEYQVFLSAGLGSTPPIYCAYDREMWASYCAAVLRTLYQAVGATTPSPIALFGSSDRAHTLPRLETLFTPSCAVVGLQDGTRAALRQLGEVQPATLIGYSSAIELAARATIQELVSLSPQVVLVGTDELSDRGRRAILDAWGVRPYQYYSMTELGVLGQECHEHRGFHVNTDMVYVEEDGRELLATGLVNEAQPFIRYRLPDHAHLDATPCQCQLSSPRIRLLQGRSRGITQLPALGGGSAPVHPIVFRSALDGVAPGSAVSTDSSGVSNELYVRLGIDADQDAVRAKLEFALRRANVDLTGVKLTFSNRAAG